MANQDLLREYEARTPKSRAMHERLLRVLPGGETRSVTHFAPYPLALQVGSSASLWDVDGNRYVDVLNNYTSLVHGHTFGPVIEALARAAAGGTAFSGPHASLLELAELLANRYPSVESVRFTNSGTEAALLALRIARRVTGRSSIVLFEGAYHGTAPQFADPDPTVIRVPYNDLAALDAALGDDVAAVLAEPFLGSAGVLPAHSGYLQEVASMSAATGALFVLDEVQSLRNAERGVHGALGLQPDLLIMGKIIGGGLPVGAVGGRRPLLEVTAATRSGFMAHSGTFNGNPLTMAAGVAGMHALDSAAISTLNQRATHLAASIATSARSERIPVAVTQCGSILQVHLQDREPQRATEVAADHLRTATLHLALLLEGIYAAPRGMLNLSTVMTDSDITSIADGYRRAFGRLAEASRD